MTSCSSFFWLVLFAKLVTGQDKVVVLNPDHEKWQIGFAENLNQNGESLSYPGNVGGVSALNSPKRVENWDVYRELVEIGLGKLQIKKSEYGNVAILVIRLPHAKDKWIEMDGIAKIMFSDLMVGKLFFVSDALCVLAASGRTTGTVVEVLDAVTYIVPFYEFYSLPHAIQVLNLGSNAQNSNSLFDPSLEGSEEPGIGELTKDAIWEVDVDERKDLTSNVVGFGSVFENSEFVTKFNTNVIHYVHIHQKYKVKTVSSVNGIMKGGAHLSRANRWLTLQEYQLHGQYGLEPLMDGKEFTRSFVDTAVETDSEIRALESMNRALRKAMKALLN